MREKPVKKGRASSKPSGKPAASAAVLKEKVKKEPKVAEDFNVLRKILSGINDMAFLCDLDGNILLVNETFEKYTGCQRAEYIGKPFSNLFKKEFHEKIKEDFAGALKGESSRLELFFGNTGIPCEFRNVPLRDEDGHITGIFGTARDISGRVRAEQALRAERDRAQKYLDVAGVMIILINSDQKVSLINMEGCKILGYSERDIIGKNWFDAFVPKTIREEARAAFLNLISGEPASKFYESPVLTGSGEERVISWHNTTIRDERGRVYATLGSGNDVTRLKQTFEELNRYRGRLEEFVKERTGELDRANARLKKEVEDRKRAEFELKKLSTAVEQSISIIYITGVDGAIEYVNPKFEEVTGYSASEIKGKSPWTFISDGADAHAIESIFCEAGWKGVLKNRKKSGESFWCKGAISPIKDETGAVRQYLAVYEDITESKTSTEQIRYLANYDRATGLINRQHFIDRLNEWIEEAGENGRGSLLLLDLDQFKFITDTYGYGMGDELLRRVGNLLHVTMRYVFPQHLDANRETLVCRLSGDEFSVFVYNAGKKEATAVAEQVRMGLENFFQPDVPCHMTASVGISLYPEQGRTTTALLTKSDSAMFRAKELGRNRIHVYDSGEKSIEKMHSRLRWKEDIIKAIKDDRFEAWFQPILDLKENKVTHYEVLARMHDSNGNIILPGPFIDIAERFGIAGAVSRVIIGKAFKAQSERSKTAGPVKFCINISARELCDSEFFYFIQSKLAETAVDPKNIILEITDTLSIDDIKGTAKAVNALKRQGLGIALDNFGIGVAPFLYMRELKTDFVKIAAPFVKDLDKNMNDRLFVKSVAEVARGMGIRTIAEFVEREEIIEILKGYDVDYVQGYLIGKPVRDLPKD